MKRTLFFFLSFAIATLSYSQSLSPEVTASAGDHFTGNNIQLSWTIGEVMIDTYVTGTSQLNQGFHQGFLITTAVEDLAENMHIEVFPNPTAAALNMEWSADISEVLTLSLYDVTGKELLSEKAFNQASQKKTIDLTAFATGTYFLQLSNLDEKIIKTFKIVKIQ